jgi:uncharacterized protein
MRGRSHIAMVVLGTMRVPFRDSRWPESLRWTGPPIAPAAVMNRTARTLATATAAAAAALALYATLIEPRWLRIRRSTLHFRGLPPALEGLRIALLSDLHAGRFTPDRLIRRTVRMTMSEGPDLIAVTGDLVEGTAGHALPAVLERLSALSAPLGVCLVPGNHDHRTGIDRWHEAVAHHPELIDLTNTARTIEVGSDDVAGKDDVAKLCIAGVDDLAEGEPDLGMLPPPASRDFTILLAHEPDQAEFVRRTADDVDLVLSGHTHGGQVRLPGLGAIISSSDHPDLYQAGVRRRPWTQVYTSAGIGTVHLPVRFLTRPELAILTLTGRPRAVRRRRAGQPGPVS